MMAQVHGNRAYLAPSMAWQGRRIGLYGGSFNPAHEGHLHVSQRALKALKLDAVWWLVSPLNPLKSGDDMATLDKRLAAAHALRPGPRVHITSLEQELQSTYSEETLRLLLKRHPRTRFVWIMGADNLATFHAWRGWRAIFHMLPIAVIDRPGYSLRALSSPAARTFANQRVPARQAAALATANAPAWTFLRGRLHPASATHLRVLQPDWLLPSAS